MDEEIKKVLFEMAASHAILAAAEYKRDISYNDSHFSAVAEQNFIRLIQKHDLMETFLGYCKEYQRKAGVV